MIIVIILARVIYHDEAYVLCSSLVDFELTFLVEPESIERRGLNREDQESADSGTESPRISGEKPIHILEKIVWSQIARSINSYEADTLAVRSRLNVVEET